MSKVPPDWYVLTRFVIDEATISGDDPRQLTLRYHKVEGDFLGRLLDYIRNQTEAFYFDGEVQAPASLTSERRFN